MKKTIALIYGGEGYERDISRTSAKNIFALIDKEKYDILPIYISVKGNWYITEEDPFGKIPLKAARPTYPVRLHSHSGFLCGGGIRPVDLALPILHGDFGEDGRVQGTLDCAHIKYLGAKVGAGALCADKIYTKALAQSLSIPSAPWIFATLSSTKEVPSIKKRAEEQLGYPMFVKPASLGSSIGARCARSSEELTAAILHAATLDKRILIERFLDVECEIECAYLEADGQKHFLAGGKISSGGAVYDFDAKYNGINSPKISHSTSSFDAKEQIEEYARRLADIIGVRHLCRFDFFITKDKNIYFNEINPLPGMTDKSLFPLLCEDMGFKDGKFINTLIESLA